MAHLDVDTVTHCDKYELSIASDAYHDGRKDGRWLACVQETLDVVQMQAFGAVESMKGHHVSCKA